MAGKVKIYSTPGCGLCDQAKKFLSARGVEADLVDVTRDTDALREMKTLAGGARTAPVIALCNKVLVGFNKEELEEAAGCL